MSGRRVHAGRFSFAYNAAMDAIERLTALFERFPGIGPRQAQRFVQYLLRSSATHRREIADAIESLAASAHQCTMCMRFYSGKGKTCDICMSDGRNHSSLALVASDADLAALERSGTYQGLYFVLGGTISLASEKASNLRIPQLLKSIPHRAEVKEVILAFPANPEGDATAIRLKDELSKFSNIKITSLGRGLSTGSELEYADAQTLKSALDNRR